MFLFTFCDGPRFLLNFIDFMFQLGLQCTSVSFLDVPPPFHVSLRYSRPVKTQRPRKHQNCRSTTRRLPGDRKQQPDQLQNFKSQLKRHQLQHFSRVWKNTNQSEIHELHYEHYKVRNYTPYSYITVCKRQQESTMRNA